MAEYIVVQENEELIPGIAKLNKLYVKPSPDFTEKYEIINDNETMGIYTTKKRCMEIIQNIIHCFDSLDTNFFKMPKE